VARESAFREIRTCLFLLSEECRGLVAVAEVEGLGGGDALVEWDIDGLTAGEGDQDARL